MAQAAQGALAPTSAGQPSRAASARGRYRLAAAVAIVCWAGPLISLTATATLGLPFPENGFLILYLLNAPVYGSVAALLLAARPHPVAAVLAVMAVGSSLSAVGVQYGTWTRLDATLPGAWIAQGMLDRFWLPGTVVSLAILPLLVTERPLGRLRRTLVGIAIGLGAALAPLTVLRQRTSAVENLLAPEDPVFQRTIVFLFSLTVTASVVLALISLVIVAVRWLREPAEQRRGLGWIVIGQALLVVFFGPTFLPWLDVAPALSRYLPLALPLSLLFMPAAVLVGALGNTLYRMDVALNRTVVWVLLWGALVAGYGSAAYALTTWLPVPPLIAGVLAVVALTLLIDPLRRWIQRRVDALVYGTAADPAQLVASLGERLTGGPAQALDDLLDALRDALRLDWLELRSERPDGIVVESGTPSGAVGRIELRNSFERVGVLQYASRNGQRPDRRAVRALEELAGVLGIALQLADVSREADEAVERMREVRDEERALVRRELSTSLAPALTADVDRLRAVLPDPAPGELEAIGTRFGDRASDVRDLARTLLPGALDAGDLQVALAELAERFSGPGLRISVEASGAGRLRAARQALVHHLAAEVVLLVRRLPDAARLELAVSAGPAGSTMVIASADARFEGDAADAALSSIRARADEAGAEVEVRTTPAGTDLVVRIPA